MNVDLCDASPAPVREWDLIELPSGEILTVVGTYLEPRARGRLTYTPDVDGALEIFGRRYRKTSYEIGGRVEHAEQVLAFPGESHYLVRANNIVRHHSAMPLEATRPELVDLVAALAAADIPVTVGGSRALGAARAGSDYDLVVNGQHNIARAASVITGLPGYAPGPHFGMDFVRAKYRHFTRLSVADLELLVANRWRHFHYRGLPMSVDGSDPGQPADTWTSATVQVHGPGRIRGTIVDASQCYISPRIIDIRTDGDTVQAFTWLNLYAGALRHGDEVEVHGHWAALNGQRFLVVEDSRHAIRVLTRTSSDPV